MANELMSEDLAQTHAEGFFNSFTLCENFIDSVEESNLVDEVQPHLERQVYEKDHWDEVSYTISIKYHPSLLYFCLVLDKTNP